MKLFGKKEEKRYCGSGQSNFKDTKNIDTKNKLLILGLGCSKCIELENNILTAISQIGADMSVRHVTDFGETASYGVMSTPALVLNGKVISYGKVLSVEEAKKILQKNS